jgi:phospholipid transport system substrate-binding protein
MKKLYKLFAVMAVFLFANNVMAAQEPADVFMRRVTGEVLDIVKADKDIQGGNQKRVMDLVEAKILPYVNFQRMTALAAGHFWREATPEQQKQLANAFRDLLIYSYAGALSQVKDQKLQFQPLRADPSDTEVVVRSQVIQARGEPIQLKYRLEKAENGWRIYDINILGAWLVETYKGNFKSEISKSGIDGLIKVLADRNKKLANKVAGSAS